MKLKWSCFSTCLVTDTMDLCVYYEPIVNSTVQVPNISSTRSYCKWMDVSVGNTCIPRLYCILPVFCVIEVAIAIARYLPVPVDTPRLVESC